MTTPSRLPMRLRRSSPNSSPQRNGPTFSQPCALNRWYAAPDQHLHPTERGRRGCDCRYGSGARFGISPRNEFRLDAHSPPACRRFGCRSTTTSSGRGDIEYTARILRRNFRVLVPESVAVHKTTNKHSSSTAVPDAVLLSGAEPCRMLLYSHAWSFRESCRSSRSSCLRSRRASAVRKASR